MGHLALWTTIGLLLAHELDAVRCHEWRVLPLTSFLPEKLGQAVFIWAHVPLVALLAWVAAQDPRSPAAIAVSGFAVLHVGLHGLFRNHPAYEFGSPTSRLLILLPGLSGLVHLATTIWAPAAAVAEVLDKA